MMNRHRDESFTLAELEPHFERQIADLDKHIAGGKAKFDRDAYSALDWSDDVFEAAALRNWVVGIRDLCVRLAKTNDGRIPMAEVLNIVQNRLIDAARNSSWSSSPSRVMMRQAELAILAKANDGFGSSLLSAFERAFWERQHREAQAKAEAASYHIVHKNGKRWRTQGMSWTGKVEKAGVWPYHERPAIEGDERYKAVEPEVVS